MNLFQLIFKQMRQRALSSCLTILSVLLGVSLAVAVLIVYRGSGALFGQKDYGYEIILGAPKGSPLQLVLNTIYQLDQSPGPIPYSLYEEMIGPKQRADVRYAFPYAVGDSYKGQRIVGTIDKTFGCDDEGQPLRDHDGNLVDPTRFAYRGDDYYQIDQGKMFAANKFEAVIGSDMTRLTGLKIGDTFHATHGLPGPNDIPDIHSEIWKVVGVLKPTGTASDKVVWIPLMSFYCIFEHGEALKAMQNIRNAQAGVAPTTAPAAAPDDDAIKHYTLNPDGTINLALPKSEWEVSAILIKTRSDIATEDLLYEFRIRTDAVAANPATVMREFFNTFLSSAVIILLIVAMLVSVVAAVSILVSIYNSVAARNREIAILRALGATRVRVLTLICVEAMLLGFFGSVLGVIIGHFAAFIGSLFLNHYLHQQLNWLFSNRQQAFDELYYVIGVVIIAFFAGLVPALKAYRTPVATNLTAV